MAWWLVPVVVGLMQPVLWQMNLRLAKGTGDMEAAVILHVVGTVVGFGWVAAGLRQQGFSQLGSLPWWAFLGGAIGVTCMAAMNRAIPSIGVAAALALTVAAQLVAALLFEQFGLLGAEERAVSMGRWLGVGLLTVGAWLVTR